MAATAGAYQSVANTSVNESVSRGTCLLPVSFQKITAASARVTSVDGLNNGSPLVSSPMPLMKRAFAMALMASC